MHDSQGCATIIAVCENAHIDLLNHIVYFFLNLHRFTFQLIYIYKHICIVGIKGLVPQFTDVYIVPFNMLVTS